MIEFDHPLISFPLKSEPPIQEPDRSVVPHTMPQPVHRAIEDGDVEEILALQNRTFGSKRTRDDWNWKLVDNPCLKNAGVVGVAGGRIISTYTIVGFKLNVLGAPVLVGHSTDTVIDSEFRGKGYFQLLFDYSMRYGQCIGSQAAIGFPNGQAIRTNLNQSEVNPLAVIKAFSQRLRFPHKSWSLRSALLSLAFSIWIQSRLIARLYRLRIAVGPSIQLEKTSTIPETYEQLWDCVRKREIVSFWKDSQYMKWRYGKNPKGKSEYFCATKEGVLCGFAAVTRRGDIAYITELMVVDSAVDLGKLLVNEILQDALNHGVEVVKFYGHDRGFFDLVFSDFMRQPAEDIVFIGQVYNDLLRELCKQPLNLCITTGDCDASW